MKKYSFVPSFKKIFEEKIVWDLEHDLRLIAGSYFNLMENNRPIYLIAVQERTTMPELMGLISGNTKQLLEYISNYFKEMQRQKKMIESDANAEATAFLALLYGYFSSAALWGTLFIGLPKEEFIETGVRTFCNGIKI
ncbi:hypothetical protein LJK88_07965 [Paenibacillus sp. P26]|nr:hypothetical protein LJK88_07965 [Paenibacillus sp. P26]UUZ90124.1 hypothetical protein LJK87_29570 [Paenibacillus sp. P25]